METKKCTGCELEKSLNDFGKKSKTKLHSRCKVCIRKKIKEHYQNNKQYYIDKAARHSKVYRQKNRQFIWDYLKDHPCVDCGESDPIVLEFDHLRDKDKDVSSLITRASSVEKIKSEIEKCEVRCANCHRRKTAKQRNWFKYLINND